MKATPAPAEKPTLQAARKAFARTHICNAARELFHDQGYGATTFDQIAKAAGTRRTTLYSHFRDKAEILELIAEEYQQGLCALVAMLEGPVPPDLKSTAGSSRWSNSSPPNARRQHW